MARRSFALLLVCLLAFVGLRLGGSRRAENDSGRAPILPPLSQVTVEANPDGEDELLRRADREEHPFVIVEELHRAASPDIEKPGIEAEVESPARADEKQEGSKKDKANEETANEDSAGGDKAKKNPGDKLFSPGMVPRISILIDREGVRLLDRNARRYVEATVEADGKTYSRVGVHLKGAVGSFQQLSGRPALTLKFNKFIQGQKFHGLSKLHLNNSVQDRTYMNELLAGELFQAAGVPAARATHARVTLNGRDLRLYVLKEAFDRRFLRRHFKDDTGNLYDGGFCRDIQQDLENDTHRESHDRSDLLRLVSAAEERNPDERWRRLGQVLDIDRFVSFMALEVLLWDWDGYPMKPNNYRIYHDPESDRLIFFPHGMDQLLSQPNGSIAPPMGGLVARAVMGTPAGKAKYFERLAEISSKLFRPEVLEHRINEVRDRIVPLATEPGLGRDSGIDNRLAGLRESIRARATSVERQLLQKPARPLALDEKGLASLASQRWYTEKDTGGVEAAAVTGADGAVQLLVDSHGSRCLGSWRCRVLLGRGSYTLRCRVRTEGVVPLADKKGSGAGLRLGGTQTPRQNQALGDGTWQMLEHDFDVAGSAEDVELVCELRATEGRAWFDKSSLAIVARGRAGR